MAVPTTVMCTNRREYETSRPLSEGRDSAHAGGGAWTTAACERSRRAASCSVVFCCVPAVQVGPAAGGLNTIGSRLTRPSVRHGIHCAARGAIQRAQGLGTTRVSTTAVGTSGSGSRRGPTAGRRWSSAIHRPTTTYAGGNAGHRGRSRPVGPPGRPPPRGMSVEGVAQGLVDVAQRAGQSGVVVASHGRDEVLLDDMSVNGHGLKEHGTAVISRFHQHASAVVR